MPHIKTDITPQKSNASHKLNAKYAEQIMNIVRIGGWAEIHLTYFVIHIEKNP